MRDRGALAALGLMLATIAIVAAITTFGQPSDQQEAPHGDQQVEDDAQGDIVEPIASDFRFWNDPFPQWAMAFFAAIATGTSVLGVIWIRQTLDATRATANAAVEANETARELGQAQVRAYISVSSLRGGAVESERAVWIEAYIKNTGQTPARHIDYRAGLVFVDRDGRHVHAAQGVDFTDPVDLLPGEARKIYNFTSKLSEERFHDLQTRFGSVLFEGRVSYETVFHQRPTFTPWTRFMYEVRWQHREQTTDLRFVRTGDENHAN